MTALQALLWDVDGTLAETEGEGHLAAFNQTFEAHGLARRWDDARYMELLHVTGGRERVLLDMPLWPDAPATPDERDALARRLHRDKNERYGAWVRRGGATPRPGVLRLIAQARAQGWRQGICTTTSRPNAEALFDHLLGADWRDTFSVTVCGEDVTHKKPHPEVYQRALQALGCEADEVLAIEDSEPGLRAARAAGLRVLLSPSRLFPLPAQHDAWHVCLDLDHADLAPGQVPQGAALAVDTTWLASRW